MTIESLPATSAAEGDSLARLRLAADEQQALAQQGFVSAEYREQNGRRYGPYFKLRWRQDGRQRVRYLGRDLSRAEQVSAALANLQRSLQLVRDASSMMAEVRKEMRKLKETLEPHLASQGMHLHGYIARRKTKPRSEAAK